MEIYTEEFNTLFKDFLSYRIKESRKLKLNNISGDSNSINIDLTNNKFNRLTSDEQSMFIDYIFVNKSQGFVEAVVIYVMDNFYVLDDTSDENRTIERFIQHDSFIKLRGYIS